jgi:hypothetical protein
MKQYISQFAFLALLFFTQQVQSIYFYLEPGMEKCFKDEVVKNYTLEMTINVLDKEIVQNYKKNLKQSVDGIRLTVLDSAGI